MSSCFDKEFRQINWSSLPEGVDDFENCEFNACDFSNANFSRYRFTDCTFSDCNLSLMKVSSTSMQSVLFRECKMLGIHFDSLNAFGIVIGFESCTLNHSSFYQLNLKKSPFNNCELQECDFSECDLSGAIFSGSNLLHAKFDRTNLEGTDFTGAVNFTIHPEINKMRGAKFSSNALSGLLTHYKIQIFE